MSPFRLGRYRAEHVYPLLDQTMNHDIRDGYRNGMAALLENHTSVTGFMNDRPMVCGGVVKMWEGRGCVWTVFNEEAKHCFVPVFRGIRRFLKTQLIEYRRLELAVPISFEIGHRRALMLGFKVESHLARKFLPNGEDCTLYSMVREE